MRKKILLNAILIATSFTAFAQMGIGTTSPEGALDVVSSDSGVVLPRIANVAAVTTPVDGMMIYDLSSSCIRVYQNSAWSVCVGDTNPGVVSSTGQVWMDRNLGASQVATSSTDAASYGDLYQWGRNTDGHEKRTSTLAAGPVASGDEGSSFITASGLPVDWLITQDDTRWNGDTKGTHDPCPTGYRVPTAAELNAERLLFPTNDVAGAFASPLKLTAAGRRMNSTGNLSLVGDTGYYWSSMVNNSKARVLVFYGSNAGMNSLFRAYGYSVRCIRD